MTARPELPTLTWSLSDPSSHESGQACLLSITRQSSIKLGQDQTTRKPRPPSHPHLPQTPALACTCGRLGSRLITRPQRSSKASLWSDSHSTSPVSQWREIDPQGGIWSYDESVATPEHITQIHPK